MLSLSQKILIIGDAFDLAEHHVDTFFAGFISRTPTWWYRAFSHLFASYPLLKDYFNQVPGCYLTHTQNVVLLQQANKLWFKAYVTHMMDHLRATVDPRYDGRLILTLYKTILSKEDLIVGDLYRGPRLSHRPAPRPSAPPTIATCLRRLLRLSPPPYEMPPEYHVAANAPAQ